MRFILLYAIIMANGEVLTTDREAHTQNWRPVRSAVQCYQVAKAQQERMNIYVHLGNHVVQRVIVTCRRGKR